MNLSIAIITKNEEAVIERCLKSLQPFDAEIIVIDTGSTDNTKEIAAKYATVYDFKWIDDFAAARNFSFSKCTREWLLWCDSDDVMLPEDIEKIKKLDLSNLDMVLFDYEYAHDEYGRSICTVPRERLVRRSLNVKWEGEIHEIMPLRGRHIYRPDIKIHHYKQAGTSERNLKILENIVKSNPQNTRNTYYLGKEYADAGMIDKAIPVLKKCIKKKDIWWEDKYAAYQYLANCYKDKGNEKLFKENLFRSIGIEERRAEPYYTLGLYYSDKALELNDRQLFLKAIHWYKLCLNLERPKELWGSYRPEFYTWKPCLQLCMCYNAIGEAQKAYEYNKKVLEYRPNDSVALNNDNILKQALKRKKDGQGKKLNLGCGGKKIEGYVNVDLFDGADEQFQIDEVPYKDNTISAINSEHSLEHLEIERAINALKEWYRVLQPGGELLLKIPDLEECCSKYLHPNRRSVNGFNAKDWYKYCIYGIQKSQAGEPDEAQIHRSGFSQRELANILEDIGFIIDYNEKYDGWGAPSIGIRAVKPLSNMKVGWIAPLNYEAAQTRIRVLNVDRWLRSKGYKSKVVDYGDILRENYDVAIVGKGFDENHYLNIKMLKQYGKTVFCDLCEDILYIEGVVKILKICDLVICCSYKLEEKVKEINPKTVVIEDSYES